MNTQNLNPWVHCLVYPCPGTGTKRARAQTCTAERKNASCKFTLPPMHMETLLRGNLSTSAQCSWSPEHCQRCDKQDMWDKQEKWSALDTPLDTSRLRQSCCSLFWSCQHWAHWRLKLLMKPLIPSIFSCKCLTLLPIGVGFTSCFFFFFFPPFFWGGEGGGGKYCSILLLLGHVELRWKLNLSHSTYIGLLSVSIIHREGAKYFDIMV